MKNIFETTPDGRGVVITKYTGQGRDLTIPATIGGKAVIAIGDSAFSFCFRLASLTIPGNVTAIGERAFYDCSNLAALNVSSENRQYKDIHGVLFTKDGKTLLAYPMGNARTAYTIPGSVTAIGDGAFSFCFRLASITIPESVITIGDGAFSGCIGLTSLTIPGNVTAIGNEAFPSAPA